MGWVAMALAVGGANPETHSSPPPEEVYVFSVLRGEVSWSGGLFRAPSASAGWFGVPVARAPGSESTAKPLNMYEEVGHPSIKLQVSEQ